MEQCICYRCRRITKDIKYKIGPGKVLCNKCYEDLIAKEQPKETITLQWPPEDKDISYCGCFTCEHTECERHTDNCPPYAKQVRISVFAECEYWKEDNE